MRTAWAPSAHTAQPEVRTQPRRCGGHWLLRLWLGSRAPAELPPTLTPPQAIYLFLSEDNDSRGFDGEDGGGGGSNSDGGEGGTSGAADSVTKLLYSGDFITFFWNLSYLTGATL